MRESTWLTEVHDATCIKTPPFQDDDSRFATHYRTATRMMDFVLKCRPHIVGIEDFTNQSNSHVAFSIAALGTTIRMLMWEAGIPFVNIAPIRLLSFVGLSNRKANTKQSKVRRDNKQAIIAYVKENLGAEFEGNAQELTDMADASVYALMAATFFSGYWLNKIPPISSHQLNIFKNNIFEHQEKNGLLDKPHKFLARNPNKENMYQALDIKNFKFDEPEVKNEVPASSTGSEQ